MCIRDRRLLLGMDSEAIHEALKRRIAAVVANTGVSLQLPTAYPPIPPFQSGPNGELLDALSGLSGNQPVTVAFCTKAHFMQALGMKTVVRWPGSVDQAHQPKEYLDKAKLAPAKDTLHRVIQKFCLV